MSWNLLQSISGLLSRKQRDKYALLDAKAKAEGKTAYGKIEELVDSYLSGCPVVSVPNRSNTLNVQGTPAASVVQAVPALSSLQSELERTKQTLKAAFELSDMLRPEPVEQEDDLLSTLMQAWIRGKAEQQAGTEDTIERALSPKKKAGVAG